MSNEEVVVKYVGTEEEYVWTLEPKGNVKVFPENGYAVFKCSDGKTNYIFLDKVEYISY